MYTVFSHALRCSYSAPVCSKATVFYILSTVLTFIPPLLIAYRSQGFWQRVDTYREQPDVHFSHQLIVQAETDADDVPVAWSTFNGFNQMLGANLRVPVIKSFETDWNHDGLLDSLDLRLELPLREGERVHSVDLILLFDVRLHRYSSVHLSGLAHASASSALSGAGVSVTADLGLVQKQPIAHKGRDDRFAESVFHENSIFAEDFDFATALRTYAQRNVSVRLENAYVLWRRGSASTFLLDVHVSYPEQTVLFRPGFWQMLKWAWVQYVAVLIVFVFVFRRIKTFVFEKQIFATACHVAAARKLN